MGRGTSIKKSRHDEMLRVRLTADEVAEFNKAANLTGLTLSAWIRHVAHEAVAASARSSRRGA